MNTIYVKWCAAAVARAESIPTQTGRLLMPLDLWVYEGSNQNLPFQRRLTIRSPIQVLFFEFMFVVLLFTTKVVWPSYAGHWLKKTLWVSTCLVVLASILVIDRVVR